MFPTCICGFALLSLVTTQAMNPSVLNNYESAKIELENYIESKKSEINPRFRPLYHVAPPVGWMNDPNGFSFHNGIFHLFYQFYPYDSVWGPMHWGHVSSTDLVYWKQLPTALLPEKEQCFSGSAISQGDKLTLMYTGRTTVDIEPYYNETQYLAYSNDGIHFYKYEGNPVLSETPNNSPDFRDPKVWKYKDNYYVIVGSQTSDKRGRVLLYKSSDMISWEFLSVLGESNGDMGYMWECPDFFELDGKFVLLMSPQGLQPQGDRYKNVHQTGYIIGSFDYDTNEFIQEGGFQEIDFGHDFYAATTTEANGKRYLIGWFSMWEQAHPEDVDGWAGMLTIVRELKVVDNRITMKPVQEIVNLRNEIVFDSDLFPNQVQEFDKAVELLIDSDFSKKIELLLEGQDGGEKAWLRWNPETRKVAVDRGSNDIRQVEWFPVGKQNWQIFLDASSLELFCGEGEVVFSTRIYALGGWKLNNKSQQSVRIQAYSLNRSTPE